MRKIEESGETKTDPPQAIAPGHGLTAAALLDFEVLGPQQFRSLRNQDNFKGAIFGGQFLGQALAAAQRTVGEWPAHSCTGYFLERGTLTEPVDYDVELTRDGRRFAARRVVARQAGKPVFEMLCSFHDAQTGFAHQLDGTADVPSPESLPNLRQFAAAHADRLPKAASKLYSRVFPIELRLIEPERLFFGTPSHSQRCYWFRMASAEAIADARDHRCLLAFMSDYWFAAAAGLSNRSPQAAASGLSVASLNHSLWIHGAVRADEWLLFRTESPWAGEGRAMVRGLIYDRSGRLVASAAQEIGMRLG